MLSQAVEDYLKTIYKLQQGVKSVSTSDVARSMSVSSASVTNMVKRLAQLGLVEYESYRGVTVTHTGEKVALEIIRHHRLLELYLKEVMGYSWEKVHEEAEHLEHHISEDFEDKLDELLGFPTHDPHGDPIPTREGEIADSTTDPLADVEPGRKVIIQRVSDSDPAMLSYLEEIGLLPGTSVVIVDKAPFQGPITIRMGGGEQVVGHRIASNVFVEPEKPA